MLFGNKQEKKLEKQILRVLGKTIRKSNDLRLIRISMGSDF